MKPPSLPAIMPRPPLDPAAWVKRLANFFPLPRWCLGCKKPLLEPKLKTQSFLCGDCSQNLPWFDAIFCRQCGGDHSNENCDKSWAKGIDEFHCLFSYEPPISDWIIAFKYGGEMIRARLLKSLLEPWFKSHQELFEQIDLILPIPMHPVKQIWRGFNQTHFLLSGIQEAQLAPKVLIKTRLTQAQASGSVGQRSANLKGVFKCQGDLKGKNLLIFDDVVTTGATLGEVVKTLKRAGAGRIEALVLARTEIRYKG